MQTPISVPSVSHNVHNIIGTIAFGLFILVNILAIRNHILEHEIKQYQVKKIRAGNGI